MQQRRAITHVLNAIVCTFHATEDGPKADADPGLLFRWVVEQGLPLPEVEQIVSRAFRTGMPVNIGAVEHTLARLAVSEQAADVASQEDEAGAAAERAESEPRTSTDT